MTVVNLTIKCCNHTECCVSFDAQEYIYIYIYTYPKIKYSF